MTEEQRLARIAELQDAIQKKKLEKLAMLRLQQQLIQRDKILYFHRPNPPQRALLEAWKDPLYRVFTYTGANQIGKTTILIIIAYSIMYGEWPWSGEKIEFPHSAPRKCRLVGQDWEKQIKAVLVPKLEEWWPKSRAVGVKKNSLGIPAYWQDEKTGSVLEVLSNLSDSDVMEGWEGDFVGYDEPPKRANRVACARGLLARGGRELFCATLLKEPWIHREVIQARNEDGTPNMKVWNINADVSANVGYGLTQENVDDFASKLTEKEKQARLAGRPSYLSNLIWNIDRKLHIRKDFPVPLDWMVDVEIDFHPSKPWAVQFLATDPRNFKWVIHEIEEHGNSKFMAEKIVKYLRQNELRVGDIEIDPLAKGDSNNDETVYDIMCNTFAAHGITLRVASKDKDNGIKIIESLLMTENEMPALFFFESCKKSIEQAETWMVDPETGKPSKTMDEDFCECLYRHGLKNTIWYEQEEEDDYYEDRRGTGYGG